MASEATSPVTNRERIIVGTLFLCQVLNILEFMIVMPLGPDFARELNFDTAKLGLIGGSYTFSAACAGILGSFFLDKFGRKKVLSLSVLGLGIATFLVTRANGLTGLLLARVLSGLMGGPLSSMVMAIVADVVPIARRGKAIGIVMGAFAIASVIGVPLGLELALLGTWRTPFYLLVVLAVILFIIIQVYLPSLALPESTSDLNTNSKQVSENMMLVMFRNPAVRMSLLAIPTIFAGNFMVIPNMATYVQNNLAYPRTHMSILYFYGGLAALLVTQLGGILSDRLGSVSVNICGTILLVFSLVLGFIIEPSPLPVAVIFMSFMAASSLRNVSFFAQLSQVPKAAYRARFMSLQSAINHMSVSLGAFVSTKILVQGPSQELIGMHEVAFAALFIGLFTPYLLARVRREVIVE